MEVDMITRQMLINAVTEALENKDVVSESNSDNTEGWDSLGQLSILSKLDEITGGKSSEIDGLASCISVHQLVEKLKSNNLISD